MFNKVIVIANLTKDPELKYTPAGVAVVNLRLAINRTYKGKDGEKKEEVCFITAVAWDKKAENANQYLAKGSKILVEGRLQSRSWEVEGIKKYAIEIVVENIQFLNKKEKASNSEAFESPALEDGRTSEETWLSEEER